MCAVIIVRFGSNVSWDSENLIFRSGILKNPTVQLAIWWKCGLDFLHLGCLETYWIVGVTCASTSCPFHRGATAGQVAFNVSALAVFGIVTF